MAKNSFLLVSLKEDKAKELAQVISNQSCRQILDYLAENHDATETDLAERLNIPISTVHYNLKHLLAAGLIKADEFHYSQKGKEVNHYKLANKYIIIAPKTTYGIKEKLKSILPVSLLALVGAGFIQLYAKYTKSATFDAMQTVPTTMEEAAKNIVSAPLMEGAVKEGERAVIEKAPEVVAQAAQVVTPNYALWFLSGCIFVILLVIIFELIKSKKEK